MAISDRQKAVQNKLSSLLNNQRRQFSQAQILVQERFKKLKIVKENQRKQQIDQKNLKLAEFNVNNHKQQQSNSINQIQILKSGQPTNLNSLNNSFNLQASTGSTLKQYLYEKSVRQDQNQVHDTLNQILKLACMLNKQNAPAFQEKEMNQLQALNFIKKLLVSYLLSLQAEQVNQSSDQIDG